MSLTTASTAMSTPRLRSIGFISAATALTPSRTIAWARIVAVVVPSPATELVLVATLGHHLRAHVLELSREFAALQRDLTDGVPRCPSRTTGVAGRTPNRRGSLHGGMQ